MLAYAGGDAAAFEQLYSRHKSALYQFIFHSCNHEATARELYQDVWLRVIKARQNYQSQAPFNAWLYRIARHRLIDHYRQQQRAPLTESHDDNQPFTATLSPLPLQPDEIAHLSERADALQDALMTLPDDQREAVLLRHAAGMSVAEIAGLVDTGAETVKSRLRYAVKKLRSCLREIP